MRNLITAVFSIACILGFSSDTMSQAAPSCDPAAFGAVPDDGVPDAAFIQAALTVGNVCLRAGDYNLEKRGQYSIRVPANRVLSGVGPKSRMVMTGDGANGAWVGVLAQDSNVVVKDLSVSSELAYNTEEQTHTMQVRGPASDVIIDQVFFTNAVRTCVPGVGGCPANGEWKGGACLRAYGEAATIMGPLRVTNNTFRSCDRSGVEVQRGSRAVLIANNSFYDTGDSDIDIEATGYADVGGLGLDGVSIVMNTFDGGQQGNYAISLQCSTGVCRNMTVVGNTMFNRGVFMFNVDGIVMTGNLIRNAATTIDPTIWVSKLAYDVLISGNVVTRTGTAGPIFAVKDHNTGFAQNIAIRSNLVRQMTEGPILHYRGVQGLSFDENRIHREVMGAMCLAETSANRSSFDVGSARNHMTGLFTNPVNLGPPGPLSVLVETGNTLIP